MVHAHVDDAVVVRDQGADVQAGLHGGRAQAVTAVCRDGPSRWWRSRAGRRVHGRAVDGRRGRLPRFQVVPPGPVPPLSAETNVAFDGAVADTVVAAGASPELVW